MVVAAHHHMNLPGCRSGSSDRNRAPSPLGALIHQQAEHGGPGLSDGKVRE
jgi:hypothetical protein